MRKSNDFFPSTLYNRRNFRKFKYSKPVKAAYILEGDDARLRTGGKRAAILFSTVVTAICVGQ